MIDSPEIAESSFVPEVLPTCRTAGTQCSIAAVHSASRYVADAKQATIASRYRRRKMLKEGNK